uniref:NADH dehydrogenase [ubiquinone] 1 beta subcomplex subunit 5, mitochondrial n=1 Tax=Lepeophtheirus salmonis TaxID=72036 RepID=C1BVV3_LEPSM|nr:NADH dehydrogenase 1 beta subcomplex subunit 5, mitochondrial precursor [Lepeophtheirus salmonis]
MTLLSKLGSLALRSPLRQDPRVFRSLLSWISKRTLQTSERKKGGGSLQDLIWKEDSSMVIRPSKWLDYTIRDFFHFYAVLTSFPLIAIGSYFAIFVGPATLEPTPEGYIPNDEEYEKRFISRLYVRYVYPTFQQVYEMRLHNVYEQEKEYKRKELLKEITRVMKEVGDSKAFFYNPGYAKYLRRGIEESNAVNDGQGST